LENDSNRELDANFSNKMALHKDKQFDDLTNDRFNLHFTLETASSTQKEEEIKEFKAKRD
jgi:hypothetical protein